MVYDLYPAVDETYNFAPEIRAALATTPELRNLIIPMTTVQRNNLTGSQLWDGRTIFNTTTRGIDQYDASAGEWLAGSVTDHGGLTGLSDNDHPQYLLKTKGTISAYTEPVQTVVATTDSATTGTVTLNLDQSSIFRLNLIKITTVAIAGGTAGKAQSFTFIISNSNYAMIWPAGTRYPKAHPPILSGETWLACVRDENGLLTVGVAWGGVSA